MAFLWFGGFKPPLPPQLWRCSWPRREGRAGVSGERRRDGVWPRPSEHTRVRRRARTASAAATFGFLAPRLLVACSWHSALLLCSQSLRAQLWCHRSAGLSPVTVPEVELRCWPCHCLTLQQPRRSLWIYVCNNNFVELKIQCCWYLTSATSVCVFI